MQQGFTFRPDEHVSSADATTLQVQPVTSISFEESIFETGGKNFAVYLRAVGSSMGNNNGYYYLIFDSTPSRTVL